MSPFSSKVGVQFFVALWLSAVGAFAQSPTVELFLVDPNNTDRRLPNSRLTFVRGAEPFRYALRANVNWNGQTPRRLDFTFSRANGVIFRQTLAPTESSFVLEGTLQDRQISWLRGAERFANVFDVQAVNSSGEITNRSIEVNAISVPQFVENFLLNGKAVGNRFNFDFEFPPGGLDLSRTIPFIGPYGPKLGFAGRMSIEPEKARITGSATGGVEWISGSREIAVEVTGGFGGQFTRVLDDQFNPRLVWQFDEMSVALALEKEFTVATLTILSKFAPGAETQIGQIPILGPVALNFLRTLSISIAATPAVTGGARINISPDRESTFPELLAADVTGVVDIRATANASLNLAPFGRYGVEGYVGGRPSIQLSAAPQVRFDEFRFQAFFGATWFLGPISNNFEHIFLNVTTAPAARLLPGAASPFQMADWSIIDRSYLGNDPGGAQLAVVLAENESLVLDGNATLLSYPAMANRGDELMVVYAVDNGDPGLQFTDLYFRRYVNGLWTYPEILPNPNGGAQIFPSVAFDGRGRPVAVWQQMDDPEFATVEPLAYLGRNDIAASVFDPGTGTWSEPVIFGDSSHAELAPTIVGPMADGDLLALWTSSQLENAPIDAPAGELLQCVWDADTSTWGPITTVMPIGAEFSTYQVDAKANTGVLVYGWDDVIDDDFTDTSIRYRTYDHATKQWSAEKILSNESAASSDLNPSVLVAADDAVYVSWVRDDQLVIDRNLTGVPKIVREDASTLAGLPIFLHERKDGVVIVSWSEMTEQDDAAIVSAFYDPIAQKWSKDVVVGSGEDMETLMGITTDSRGNYLPLYLRTDLIYATKQATDDFGNLVSFDDVPQPGQRSIVIGRLPVGPDLEIEPGTFVCDSQRLFKGDEVVLTATFRNRGELTVPDAIITFYEGNPFSGGRKIGEVSAGELLGGESEEVQFNWKLPELVGEADIYAIADAQDLVDETYESNNSAAIHVGGVNLTCGDLDYDANEDGSAALSIPVYNDGAATNQTFHVRVTDPATGAELLDTSIGGLGAGEFIDLAVDLPVGFVPEPGKKLRLHVDYNNDVVELIEDDNSVEIWIANFIDEDGDGMPRIYEINNGFSDSNPLDADLDSDGDGQSNLEEMLAGTDPNDPNSRLLVTLEPGSIEGNVFTIGWEAKPFVNYTLERSSDLVNWEVLAENVVFYEGNGPVRFEDDLPDTSTKVFYRLRVN